MDDYGLYPAYEAVSMTAPRVALYLRLSREDGDKAESDSIANQRILLWDYLKDKQDFQVVEEFVDDGYTGISFERPAFLKMMEAARSGRINCILAKDLSRLGRNYIETGRYLERIFPMLGVRLIAVTEHYDSAMDDDSSRLMVVFKNMMNDSYCRDISIKIRSQLDVKRRKGQFIGSFAAYGYKKDPSDKNHLIIDEYPAEIVRAIFQFKLSGYSVKRIAQRLDEMGALTPLAYKRYSGQRFNGGFRPGGECKWSVTGVRRILENELYTGVMVQGKLQKINYKIKEMRKVDASEWIRVEGTHEAIIPREVFDAVQELKRMDTRTAPAKERLYLFCGLLKCGDCGQNMIRRNGYRNRKGEMTCYYHCSTYKNTGDCTSHLIPERVLEPMVLAAMKQQLKALLEAEERIEELRNSPRGSKRPRSYERQIEKEASEEKRYLALRLRLYQDMREGIVSKEDFAVLNQSFIQKEKEARMKQEQMKQKGKRAMHCEQEQWMKAFKAVQGLERLKRRILTALVERIVVHSKEQVEVIFRFEEEMKQYIAFADACRMELDGRNTYDRDEDTQKHRTVCRLCETDGKSGG